MKVRLIPDIDPDARGRWPRGQPGAGDRRAVQPAAAGERHRQLHQGGAARAGQDRDRSGRGRAMPAGCGPACRSPPRSIRVAPMRSGSACSAPPRPRWDVAAVSARAIARHHVSWRQWVGFMAMVVGMFMAILDIQIVCASISDIQAGPRGQPRRGVVGADQLPDRRDRHDPAVRLAVAPAVHARAVRCQRAGLHGVLAGLRAAPPAWARWSCSAPRRASSAVR